jgi:hypothetical protein
VNELFARWDERNQQALEEDNRWLSGDDWADRSGELRRLRMIRSATTKTMRFAALAAVLLGARIAVGVGDWRAGLGVGAFFGALVLWLWGPTGPWRKRYGHEVSRIDEGPEGPTERKQE